MVISYAKWGKISKFTAEFAHLHPSYLAPQWNKTKDWALVQNAASAGGVKIELGLFR